MSASNKFPGPASDVVRGKQKREKSGAVFLDEPNQFMKPWPVAVFAHNEATNIVACLNSLGQAAPGQALACFVLANACTDGTESLVRDYARTNPHVKLVSIDLGDKSNAWNVYVHELAPRDSEVHFFIDGDVEAAPMALHALFKALEHDPYANAAAALPVSGRSMHQSRMAMVEHGELAGNLYALRGDFVDRIRRAGLRLPIGLIGDDSLVGALVKWDLEPRGGWDRRRVASCETAGFSFSSLSLTRAAHWALYWRRRIRYSLRAYQLEMLKPVLKRDGIQGMPDHIGDLYQAAMPLCRLRWNGANTIFNWLALRRLRRRAGRPPAS